jgi:hypothetical protein
LRAIDEIVVPLLDQMSGLINEGERAQSSGWNAFKHPELYPDYRADMTRFRDCFAAYGRDLAAVSERLAAHDDIQEALAYPDYAEGLRAINTYMQKYELFDAFVAKEAPREAFAAFLEDDANTFGKAIIAHVHWCSETRARIVAIQRSLSA